MVSHIEKENGLPYDTSKEATDDVTEEESRTAKLEVPTIRKIEINMQKFANNNISSTKNININRRPYAAAAFKSQILKYH